VLGWGHGPIAHEHKEAEREPGNMETPILFKRLGLFSKLIEKESRDQGEKWDR
jgi:hypothetical protein